jgi:hypothetical protein
MRPGRGSHPEAQHTVIADRARLTSKKPLDDEREPPSGSSWHGVVSPTLLGLSAR